MNNKKTYEHATLRVIRLEQHDVVRTSEAQTQTRGDFFAKSGTDVWAEE